MALSHRLLSFTNLPSIGQRTLVAASIAWSCVACSGNAGKQLAAPGPDAGSEVYGADAATTRVADAQRFLMDYASAVCAMYEPCCQREGLGYAGAGCTTWFRKVTAAYFRGSFDADEAGSCLAQLARARAADAERCDHVLDFDEATLRSTCQQAFSGDRLTGAALGEKCLLESKCTKAEFTRALNCTGG